MSTKIIVNKSTRVVQIVHNPQVRNWELTFNKCVQYARHQSAVFPAADVTKMYFGGE